MLLDFSLISARNILFLNRPNLRHIVRVISISFVIKMWFYCWQVHIVSVFVRTRFTLYPFLRTRHFDFHHTKKDSIHKNTLNEKLTRTTQALFNLYYSRTIRTTFVFFRSFCQSWKNLKVYLFVFDRVPRRSWLGAFPLETTSPLLPPDPGAALPERTNVCGSAGVDSHRSTDYPRHAGQTLAGKPWRYEAVLLSQLLAHFGIFVKKKRRSSTMVSYMYLSECLFSKLAKFLNVCLVKHQ